MTIVGEVFVRVTPQTGDFENELNKSAVSTGTKVAKTLASAIGGAFVLSKIKGFAAAGLAELKDAEAAQAQIGAAIKSTGGAANVTAADVDELSSSLLKVTGVDDELITKGQGLLLTFTRVRNEVGKGNDVFDQATKTALDLSRAGFGSVESASVLLGKALNDPLVGLTALQRVGVRLSDGQKDLVKQLVSTGDTLGAQKVILEEVNRQVGGSAEAFGKTLPGQLAIAQESLANTKGEILAGLAPALKAGAQGVSFLTDEFAKQPVILQQVEGGLAIVGGAVGSIITPLKSGIDLWRSFGSGAKAAGAAADISGVVSNSSRAVDDLYSSTGRFTGRVGGMATAVGGAAIQLGILYGAIQLVGGSADHADLPKLTKDILDFARGGAAASPGAKDFASDLDGLGRAVERIAAPSGATKAENVIDSLGRALGDADDDLSQARARVDDLDKTLTGLAQQDPELAAAALKSITGALDPATARRLLTLLDDYDSAVAQAGVTSTIAAGGIEDVASAATDTEGGVDDLTEATDEAAVATKTWADRMDDARTAIDDLFDATTSSITGSLDYRDAVDSAADAVAHITELQKDDATTADDLRRAIDDAARSMLNQAQAAADSAEATAGLAGQHLDAGTKARLQKEELQRLAAALAPDDPLRAQLQGFIDQLALVPGSKSISFSVEGVDAAVAEVERLMRAGASLPADVFNELIASLGAAGFAGGGKVTPVYAAHGAFMGGPRGTDTVPLWATPGEFVMQKSAVDRWGLGFMRNLNAGAAVPMATGGLTPAMSATGSSSDEMLVQHIYTLDPVQAAAEAARRHRATRLALTLR